MDNHAFWTALDRLIEESTVIIDRPKGTEHPQRGFPYDVDYGYLGNTSAMDGGGIDVWRGTSPKQQCDAVICTIDLVKRDSEIKILLGCIEEEKEAILQFHNASACMKGLMFRRS